MHLGETGQMAHCHDSHAAKQVTFIYNQYPLFATLSSTSAAVHMTELQTCNPDQIALAP